MTESTAAQLTREDVQILNDNVPGWRGVLWHIKVRGAYYLVSAVDLNIGIDLPGYRDSETMAFPADEEAEALSMGEVGFVPFKDHWACIDDLLENLNAGEASSG